MINYRLDKHKIKLTSGETGFTLVEVLIAMSILMIIITAYTVLFTGSFENIFRAGEKSDSLFLTQAELENFIALRTEGEGQVLDLKFSEEEEYEIWGRKQESNPFTTFVAEEKPPLRFVAVGRAGSVFASSLGDEWEEYESDTVSNLNSITWGGTADDKRYLAVGGGGAITSSRDGKHWNFINSNISNQLQAVTWGGISGDYTKDIEGDRKYVAVGDGGAIIRSDDGVNWNTMTSGVSENLKGICWGYVDGRDRGYFVAVGESGVILTWTGDNKDSWQEQEEKVYYYDKDTEEEYYEYERWTDKNLNDVFWGDGRFIAVGDEGVVLISSDGENWTESSSGNKDLYGITWGYGKYVAVGEAGTILVSGDGNAWSSKNSGVAGNINDVTWSYNQFIAVSDNGVLISKDGETWTVELSATDKLYGVTGR